jgi:hypothetical protein
VTVLTYAVIDRAVREDEFEGRRERNLRLKSPDYVTAALIVEGCHRRVTVVKSRTTSGLPASVGSLAEL